MVRIQKTLVGIEVGRIQDDEDGSANTFRVAFCIFRISARFQTLAFPHFRIYCIFRIFASFHIFISPRFPECRTLLRIYLPFIFRLHTDAQYLRIMTCGLGTSRGFHPTPSALPLHSLLSLLSISPLPDHSMLPCAQDTSYSKSVPPIPNSHCIRTLSLASASRPFPTRTIIIRRVFEQGIVLLCVRPHSAPLPCPIRPHHFRIQSFHFRTHHHHHSIHTID